MNTNTTTPTNGMTRKEVAPEFRSYPASETTTQNMTQVRWAFDDLLTKIEGYMPKWSAREMAIVKTKLEEASFFAIKGMTKPESPTHS